MIYNFNKKIKLDKYAHSLCVQIKYYVKKALTWKLNSSNNKNRYLKEHITKIRNGQTKRNFCKQIFLDDIQATNWMTTANFLSCIH